MISGNGSSARPGRGRRVALDLDEIHRHEEQDDAERRIQQQREDIARA